MAATNPLISDRPPALRYTTHAARRCLERGIAPDIIHCIVTSGDLVRQYPDGVLVLGLHRLRAVFDPRTSVVITVYRVPRRNPKRRIQRQRKNQRVQQRANRFYPCF